MKTYLIKIFFLFFVCICKPEITISQINAYSFVQLDSLEKVKSKPIIVFIHTEWCKYCQQMQNTTFTNDSVINLLNSKFYFVNFDAEEKRIVKFNGHTFKYKPTGSDTGIHELAEQLATVDRKISYPTFCFLNTKYEIIFQYNQFLYTDDLLTILHRLK